MLFNEPKLLKLHYSAIEARTFVCFSALQRAEIAEIGEMPDARIVPVIVSVLFNEPKLLKSGSLLLLCHASYGFSALQRAEIAEIAIRRPHVASS